MNLPVPIRILPLLLISLSLAHLAQAIEIKPSALSVDLATSSAREKAFTSWISLEKSGERFNQLTSRRKKMVPIYSERKGDRVRDIYVKLPEDSGFFTFSGMDAATFEQLHDKHTKEGLVLLSCATFLNSVQKEEYWATWITAGAERQLVAQLQSLGISQAAVVP